MEEHIEEHIFALLNNNLRVIIPDFGAFIIRQKEPKVIVFNEFLRYNDGLLIDYIAKSEQIEKDIAEQKVTDFAEEASKTLEGGKYLQIKGLGSLTRDPSGKINFIEESAQIRKEKSRPEKKKVTRSDKGIAGKEQEKSAESNATKKALNHELSASDTPGMKKTDTTKQPVNEKTIEEQDDNLKEKPSVKTEGSAEDKPEIKPESKTKITSQQASLSETKSEAKIAAKSKVRPEPKSRVKSEFVPETKTETKAKAKPEPKSGPASESKAEPQVQSQTELKKDSGLGTGPASRTFSSSGIDDKSKQRSQMVSSAVGRHSGSELQRETKKIQPTRKSARKTSYTNQLLIGIVIILIVNILILAWFLYRDNLRQIFNKGQETVFLTDSLDISEPLAPADAMNEEDLMPVIEKTPATGKAPVTEEPVALSTGTDQPRFYIVAGCFSEETNADALVQSLRSKGFDAEKFGRIGNLHAVAYAAFDNRTNALTELERIRREEQPDAWMTRF